MTAYAPLFGAKWTDSKGNSTLSKDPQWAKFLKWQKSLVDYYGYKQLVKFHAGAADEFSASNAFEIGHLAMAMDGEWRVALFPAGPPSPNSTPAPPPPAHAPPPPHRAGFAYWPDTRDPHGGKRTDH